MIKKIILFFLLFIFFKISKEILIFNEEIILLCAGFIMFNLFIYIGWSVLSPILIKRTDEIFFIFYDLFELKLKKLILFKNLIIKKIEINKELNEIYTIIKLNLNYLYLIQILYLLNFEIYLLFIFLENILINEFNFLKLFLNKKINNINFNINNQNFKQNLINIYKLNIYNINLIKLLNYKILKNNYKYFNFTNLTQYNNILKLNIKRNNLINIYVFNSYSLINNANEILNNFYYIQTFLLFFQNYFQLYSNKIIKNYFIISDFEIFCQNIYYNLQKNNLFLNDYSNYKNNIIKA